MSDPVRIERPEPPRYTNSHEARHLTDNDLTNRETIAALRGFSGRMRAAIRDALDQLRPDEPAAKILERALQEPAP